MPVLHPPSLHIQVAQIALLIALGSTATGDDDRWPKVLNASQPLTIDEPLDVVMVRGISRFAESELAESPSARRSTWPDADRRSDAARNWANERREQLRQIIGAVDDRHPARLSRLVDPGEIGSPTSNDRARVIPVRWEVLEGVSAEGLLIVPPGKPRGFAVAIPDASWTPEMFCGLVPGVEEVSQLPRRLAARGMTVMVPMLIDRRDEFSGHPDIRQTNIPHREFIYRLTFELGRHPVGLEVQKMLAAVDLLEEMARSSVEEGDRNQPGIAICGVGDGGQLAMYTAALDKRISTALVCGYFQERQDVWQQPIDRNIWRQLTNLGDAEIAALVHGKLLIEASAAPAFDGPQPERPGHPDFAAPGTIQTPVLASVRTEFERLRELAGDEAATLVETVGGSAPAASSDAFDLFVNAVVPDSAATDEAAVLQPPTTAVDPRDRQQRQIAELVRYSQRLLHRSDKVRDRLWSDADASTVESWVRSTVPYREMVHREMIGQLPMPHADAAPRTRKVIDEPTHVGYEVLLDVIAPHDPASGEVGVIAGGILLLPKSLKEGEQRPVVVCQHGLEGTPMDTITTDQSQRAWGAYKGFSTALVQRGFIVYAPQNPYRGLHDFRVIQRKSNPLGRSLFSYIIEQHRQTLKWLATLPWVDDERIAFYGLSYGGKTAVRVPPLLPQSTSGDGDHPADPTATDGPGYCLSICSADFDDWIRKNVSAEDRYSYVYTREYEMFEWNMGHLASYAELSTLMIPRPFMVERGHDDGVAPDEWVAWEYAKVRRRYNKLGLGDKTEIEFFDGPHTINGEGTYDFLHRHLDWPVP